MAEKRYRYELDKHPVAAIVREGEQVPLTAPAFSMVEEWVPVEPTEEWSDWRVVGTVEDRDPTYYPEYVDPDRFKLWHALKAIHPRRRTTTTWERKLVRRWVDAVHGPMAEVVRTERRTERV